MQKTRLAVLSAALAAAAVMTCSESASAASAPPTPGYVTATASSPTTIHLTWDTVSGATYLISNGNETRSRPASPTSYDWTGLTPGSYMCLTVAAQTSAGVSPWSPYSCVTTSVNSPSGLTVTPGIATMHLSWTDTSSGKASFLITNGDNTVEEPPGATSYDWHGLNVGDYMCAAVAAAQGNGYSPWTPYACATTTTGSAARDDFITTLQNTAPARYAMTDSSGQTMDTAKIIQVGSSYYAVYSPGSQGVVLASASTLYGAWTPVANLDNANASQPTLAQMSDGSFVVAEEYLTGPPGTSYSFVKFLRYPSLTALTSGQHDKSIVVNSEFSACNEGTPDIHNTDPNNIQVGFHYNADCSQQMDREAFGTLTGFTLNGTPDWSPVMDTTKDAAFLNAETPWTEPSGYPGKHGGRDDFFWQGNRYSLTEVQNTVKTTQYDNFRLALYDYGNRTAYPIRLGIEPYCAANPRVTPATDNGQQVLVITAFIHSECTPSPMYNGELMYVIPRQ